MNHYIDITAHYRATCIYSAKSEYKPRKLVYFKREHKTSAHSGFFLLKKSDRLYLLW